MTNVTEMSGANTPDDKSFVDRAKEAAASVKDKASAAATSTVEAAKDHPYAAAGIAAGVAAAVAGTAYGVSKLRDDDTPATVPATPKAPDVAKG